MERKNNDYKQEHYLYGVLMIILSAFCFACMNVMVRLAGEIPSVHGPPGEILHNQGSGKLRKVKSAQHAQSHIPGEIHGHGRQQPIPVNLVFFAESLKLPSVCPDKKTQYGVSGHLIEGI